MTIHSRHLVNTSLSILIILITTSQPDLHEEGRASELSLPQNGADTYGCILTLRWSTTVEYRYLISIGHWWFCGIRPTGLNLNV